MCSPLLRKARYKQSKKIRHISEDEEQIKGLAGEMEGEDKAGKAERLWELSEKDK